MQLPGKAHGALQEILQKSAMFAKEKKKEKKSESLSGVVRLSVSDSVRPWQSFCNRVTIVPRRPGSRIENKMETNRPAIRTAGEALAPTKRPSGFESGHCFCGCCGLPRVGSRCTVHHRL